MSTSIETSRQQENSTKSLSPSKHQLRETSQAGSPLKSTASTTRDEKAWERECSLPEELAQTCRSGPDYDIGWTERVSTFNRLLWLGERASLENDVETGLRAFSEAALLEGDAWALDAFDDPRLEAQRPVWVRTLADGAYSGFDNHLDMASKSTPSRLVAALGHLTARHDDMRFAVIEQMTDVVAARAARRLARAAAMSGQGQQAVTANAVAIEIARRAAQRLQRVVGCDSEPRMCSYMLSSVARIADNEIVQVARAALGCVVEPVDASGRRFRLAVLDASLALWPANRGARLARVELARSISLATTDLQTLLSTASDDPRCSVWRKRLDWLTVSQPPDDDENTPHSDAPEQLAKASLNVEAQQWAAAIRKESKLSSARFEAMPPRLREIRTSLPPKGALDGEVTSLAAPLTHMAVPVNPISHAARVAACQQELSLAAAATEKAQATAVTTAFSRLSALLEDAVGNIALPTPPSQLDSKDTLPLAAANV